MARRAHHQCAFKALDADQGNWAHHESLRHGVTWCGDARLFSERERDKPQRETTCPKCAAALGAAMLAKLGGRVVLERLPAEHEAAKRNRSAWFVIIDGTPRGLIVNERGFGKGWDLHLLPSARDDWKGYGNCISASRPSAFDRRTDESTFHHVHYAARDAMACAAFKAWQTNQLPTVAEMQAAEAARTAERARRDEESRLAGEERTRQREEAERVRSERLEAAREALASLMSRGDLTNVELAGLDAAATLLGLG